MAGWTGASNFEQLTGMLLEELNAQNYGSVTMDNYQRAITRIGKFMESENLNDYSEEVGDAFIDRVSKSDVSESHIRYNITVVRRLNDVNEGIGYRLVKPKSALPVPAQFAKPLESYLCFCASIGNKSNTISQKHKVCVKFLCALTDLGCIDTHEITSDIICRAIVRFTNIDNHAIIRAFLRYLHEIDVLKYDYSSILPKRSRGKVLPTIYTIDEVRRLEASIDRSSKVGMRNYAALLLASRLGLRSGDIAGLTYDQVDFHNDSINLTQEKTGHPLTLPLLPEIREAIEEYVQYARPVSGSEFIFLSAIAPFGRMTTSSMRRALTECFSAADIDILEKRHGPHSLRSSLASSMVNDGVPHEVVRRLLGHRDPDAIKHYTIINIENLRCCAIEVPPPTGNFEALLEGRM